MRRLTPDQKAYIREHWLTETAHTMAAALQIDQSTVSRFGRRDGLPTKKRGPPKGYVARRVAVRRKRLVVDPIPSVWRCPFCDGRSESPRHDRCA